MKKLVLQTIFIISPFLLFAQNAVNQSAYKFNDDKIVVEQKLIVPDFTITTTDGVTRNLYTENNAGNVVVIDQFTTTCVNCSTAASTINSAFTMSGSGASGVLFWGIDFDENNAAVIAYKNAIGVLYPCASGLDGNGNAADAILKGLFSFSAYPAYHVICQDHSIAVDVNQFPPQATGFFPYVMTCITGVDQQDALHFSRIWPMPATDFINFEFSVEGNDNIGIDIINMFGQVVKHHITSYSPGVFMVTVPVEDLAAGTYLVKLSKGDQVTEIVRIMIV